jgi:hypothetical protein
VTAHVLRTGNIVTAKHRCPLFWVAGTSGGCLSGHQAKKWLAQLFQAKRLKSTMRDDTRTTQNALSSSFLFDHCITIFVVRTRVDETASLKQATIIYPSSHPITHSKQYIEAILQGAPP